MDAALRQACAVLGSGVGGCWRTCQCREWPNDQIFGEGWAARVRSICSL